MYRSKCFNSRVFTSPEASRAHPGRGESALRPTSQNSFLRAARPLPPPRFVCGSSFHVSFSSAPPSRLSKLASPQTTATVFMLPISPPTICCTLAQRVSNLPPRSRHAHRRPSLVLNQPERGACSHAAPLNPSADAKPPLTPDLSVPS